MEQFIKIMIYVHAFFGGLGLLSGLTAILVKKGSVPHKKMGKVFSISMIVSSLISIPIAWMPNHENIFLFLIGLFTIYLVVSGNQILTFKSAKKLKANWTDKLISGSMLVVSFVMLIWGVLLLIFGKNAGYLFLFFSAFGFSLTIRDFRFYSSLLINRKLWLSNHIGKMIGAFIASVTAFFVAGMGFDTIVAWMLPSVLGTVYIVFWRRKVKGKRKHPLLRTTED